MSAVNLCVGNEVSDTKGDKKRKLSQTGVVTEVSAEKRERVSDSITSLESQSAYNSIESDTEPEARRSTDQAEKMEDQEDMKKFIANMRAALQDPEIKKMFHQPSMDLIDKMDGRVAKVEVQTAENKDEIQDMKRRIDEFEQRDREANMIVKANIETEINTDSVKNLLNKEMDAGLTGEEISYVVKMGKENTNPKRIRVAFKDKAVKEQLMKKRKVLKGKNVWLSDDLTAHRSKLAYLARAAVKAGKAHASWVADSKIFLKIKDNDRPKKIGSVKDLPN
jgi:vacuolar-type H+-ATPase subunit I/STV1